MRSAAALLLHVRIIIITVFIFFFVLSPRIYVLLLYIVLLCYNNVLFFFLFSCGSPGDCCTRTRTLVAACCKHADHKVQLITTLTPSSHTGRQTICPALARAPALLYTRFGACPLPFKPQSIGIFEYTRVIIII